MNEKYRFLSGALALALAVGMIPAMDTPAAQGGGKETKADMRQVEKTGLYIQDIYTDKSRYNPGETVQVIVELKAERRTGDAVLRLHMSHMGETTWQQEFPLTAADAVLHIPVAAPAVDFTGYTLEAYLWEDGALKDYAMSAVDVSSDWNVFPRYGYITKLDNRTDAEMTEALERLKKHHINGLFYYGNRRHSSLPLAS